LVVSPGRLGLARAGRGLGAGQELCATGYLLTSAVAPHSTSRALATIAVRQRASGIGLMLLGIRPTVALASFTPALTSYKRPFGASGTLRNY